MQKVICEKDLDGYQPYFETKAFEKLQSGAMQNFECGKKYTLLSLKILHLNNQTMPAEQAAIYFDHEDLFFVSSIQGEAGIRELAEKNATNEQTLWLFFQNLLKYDMDYLEELESEITDAEMAAMVRYRAEDLRKIILYRKQLLRLKRYYDQLDFIFDCLILNENQLLTDEGIRHFRILVGRVQRYLGSVLNLRDYVTQMREAYQAQLDIEQNNLMRVFTVVTTVFLPLTLMVGWYGMNFTYMPELRVPYAYPVFIGCSISVCGGMLLFFKKKKWI